MPRRQQILILALGAMGLLFAADFAFRRLFEQPRDARRNENLALQGRLAKATEQLDAAAQAAQRLEELEQRSLPRDLQLAHSRYQSWLLTLAEQTGLKNASVNANAPNGRGTIRSLIFSLRGRGTLAQVTDFLFQFYRAGHLQKIQSLTLTPSPSSRLIELGFTIEGLSLQGATRADSLTELPSQRLASAELADYQPILRRDLFTAGGRELQARQIMLTAITYDAQGNLEAWFRQRASGTSQLVSAGETLPNSLFEVHVLKITDAAVQLDVDGSTGILKLGQSLDQVLPK